MIEELQKKFIRVAMLAVSVLILGMLGAVNVLNYTENERQIRREFEHAIEMQHPPKEDFLPQKRDKIIKEDIRFSQYAVVYYDEQGNLLNVDLSRAMFMEQEMVCELSQKVYDRGKLNGTIGNYRYAKVELEEQNSLGIVLMDISIYRLANVRIAVISIGIGICCWLGMLLLVRALSKKAIRPIAENIEKQRQFVTNAGHEIKTPLAIMQANADALELHLGENKWTGNIKGQIARLDGLMQKLLMLSKMDEGHMQFEKSEISVSEILMSEIAQYEESAILRKIVLEQDIEQDVVWNSNKEALHQLITILMDNAMKYTNDDGIIRVTLKCAKRLTMMVENTCTEIPNVEPNRLFERFYRAAADRNQRAGGYGIGLSIAYAIVTAMEGKITAEYLENRVRFIVEL